MGPRQIADGLVVPGGQTVSAHIGRQRDLPSREDRWSLVVVRLVQLAVDLGQLPDTSPHEVEGIFLSGHPRDEGRLHRHRRDGSPRQARMFRQRLSTQVHFFQFAPAPLETLPDRGKRRLLDAASEFVEVDTGQKPVEGMRHGWKARQVADGVPFVTCRSKAESVWIGCPSEQQGQPVESRTITSGGKSCP